ncbi:efflux RND transporter periplasmic adaptor subunit [Shewanella sp. SNU WT4]|uniref:efflux RND transporter periplasmic adaptor subunit n=1 Tax=Shewanella sp. SNU WT4 TaxID=2590015 RepID=UPI001F1051D7|nr:efflux RND transporter periplasmic adaptor subunit [Shewanella sp. SNU WT4]
MSLVVVAAAIAGALWFSQGPAPSESPPKGAKLTPNVVVANVTFVNVRDEVEALGNIGANESTTITSKISEVIERIYFVDGEYVKHGQLLVQLRSAEQQAQVTAAKVKLSEQTRELARISTLVTNKTVAELERDRLQSLIETAKAELDQALSALNEREIRAPFSGRLGLRNVSQGALVSPATVITTLDDIAQVKLDFTVPERFIPLLSKGQVIEASAVAFDNELFTGKVTLIDNRVNANTRAVTVRAIVPNPDGKLLPGMLMTVKLIKEQRQAIMVPEGAIIPQQDRHYVYLVNSQGVIEQRQVKLGLRQLGAVEVIDGLAQGEVLVTRGILKVRPEMAVEVQAQESFSAVKGDTNTPEKPSVKGAVKTLGEAAL